MHPPRENWSQEQRNDRHVLCWWDPLLNVKHPFLVSCFSLFCFSFCANAIYPCYPLNPCIKIRFSFLVSRFVLICFIRVIRGINIPYHFLLFNHKVHKDFNSKSRSHEVTKPWILEFLSYKSRWSFLLFSTNSPDFPNQHALLIFNYYFLIDYSPVCI